MFYVKFVTVGGYEKWALKDSGGHVRGSDANPSTGKTGTYTLASGDFNTTVDAGLLPIDLELSKTVDRSEERRVGNEGSTLSPPNDEEKMGVRTANGVEVEDRSTAESNA